MEQKLTAEKQVLEELVKLVHSRGMQGENGGWKEFLNVYDKKSESSKSEIDPSKRSHDDLVAFLTTFKKKEDLQVLRCYANHFLMKKFKQESSDNDTPEQSLVRLTVEHPEYSVYYSFLPNAKDWFVSDVGMKMSNVMKSTEMIAVDCEMVLCDDGTEGLVRVGAVDRDLKVILDKFVKPDKPIVDYRTAITGVTAEDIISKATLSVADIQKELEPFLSNGAILVGHSLNKDLAVLKIDHPRVIDTSLVFKFSNARKGGKPSLNNLCLSILGYGIQKVGVPHNSLHDAAAAMKLVLARIERRVGTTISPSKEMLEAEKSRLFLHRIPRYLPSEKLHKVLSGKFTIEVKPSKQEGGYYCAVVVFDSPEEADLAFKNVAGNLETDSWGLPQKLVDFQLSWELSDCLYVRKMV